MNNARTVRLPLVILLGGVFLASLKPETSSDLWTHMAYGREAVARRAIPGNDLFTYTREGRPWVNHAWLAGVAFYSLHRQGGIAGIIVMKAALVALAVLVVHSCAVARGAGRTSALVACGLAALALNFRIIARPYLFSWLLTAFVSLLCVNQEAQLRSKHGRRFDFAWLCAVAIVFALWANLHAGFLIGLGVVGAHACGAALSFIRERKRNADRAHKEFFVARTFFVAVFVGFAATLANPFGIDAHMYPLTVGGGFKQLREIYEWMPPDFQIPFWGFWAFLGVTVIAIAATRGRLAAADALKIAVLGAMGLRARRHGEFFVIACAPALAVHLSFWAEKNAGRSWGAKALKGFTGARGRIANCCIALAASALMIAAYPGPPSLRLRERVFPIRAAGFVQEKKIPGRIFNHYDWGGYLTWALYPEKQIFIDGRNDVCGDLYPSSVTVCDGAAGWQAVLDEWNVNCAIIPMTTGARGAQFFGNPAWAVVYWDDEAAVAVRRNAENAELIRTYECRYARPCGPPPARLDERGAALIEAELQMKIAADPDCATARYCMGQIRFAQGRYNEALRLFAEHERMLGETPETLYNMALCHARLGDAGKAGVLLSRAVKLDPKPAYVVALAQIEVSSGRFGRAEKLLRKALTDNPGDLNLRAALAALLRAQNRDAEAMQYDKILLPEKE
ncbi:MAG TPA: tetratricopeptide repeat protein [Candidatus Brocadiia bacterium]|nr:tetratricopeptide repeat protein [Candidatus Brocadiia bacterium]